MAFHFICPSTNQEIVMNLKKNKDYLIKAVTAVKNCSYNCDQICLSQFITFCCVILKKMSVPPNNFIHVIHCTTVPFHIQFSSNFTIPSKYLVVLYCICCVFCIIHLFQLRKGVLNIHRTFANHVIEIKDCDPYLTQKKCLFCSRRLDALHNVFL